jgi:prepilin-type N-terminal cleavage/methylation domain-containing protein
MHKKLNNKGFTIVEVLIVLAIAGAILAGVLVAVPALQRSGRNSTAKTAAQQLVAGVQEFASANNGTMPTGLTGPAAGSAPFSGAAGTSTVTTKVSPTITPKQGAGVAAVPAKGSVVVYFGSVCNATLNGTTALTGSIAVIYPVENGGTTVMGCIQA